MSPSSSRVEAVEVVATQLLPRASLITRLLFRQADLGRAEAGILGALEGGPLRITELAATQALAQPTVTQLVARLEEQGRVARARHPDDGRVVLVSLTDAGREALDGLRDEYRAALRQALAGRSDADVRALAKATDLLGELIAEPAVNAARRQALLTPVLFLVTCVVAVISSLGAPLIPLIAHDFDISLSEAQWSLTAALLSGAVSAPIMGRLGDGPRRREAIVGGLGIVMLGGVLAALAPSLPLLVVGRVMQGVGLGLIPLAMAAARDGLPAARVPGTIALLSVSAAAGVGAGYPISGLIAEHLGLDAAYWFGAAFALAALVSVQAVVPASSTTVAGRLDLRGAALVSAGLVALLLAIGQGAAWGWGSARILGLFAVALVLLGAWIPQQLRAPHPLIELGLLRHRAVLTADASAFVLGVAMYINVSVLTAFVQEPPSSGYGFGASVLTAGACLVPFSITSLIASRTLPHVSRILGPRVVLPIGCLIVALSAAGFALDHQHLLEAFIMSAVLGVGLGYTFAAIPGLIVRSVPGEETGSAMGFYQVVRYIGFSIGSALAASILAAHTAGGATHPAESGFVTALWVSAGICVAAAAIAFVLPGRAAAPAGDEDAALEAFDAEDAELGTAGVVGLHEAPHA